MGKIIVYNSKTDDYSSEKNNFFIGRLKEGNPLGNPFTHDGKRSNLARLSFKTRDEALKAYEIYFHEMYGKDPALTKAFDEIYEVYKSGEDVYLQCFCKPLPCHGDFLARELQQRLIKEKMMEKRKKS